MCSRKFNLLVISLLFLSPINTSLEAQNKLEPISRVFWGTSLINYPTQDFLFIGAGGAILIADIISKDSMQVLNNIYLPSVVRDIEVRSNILYALDLLSGIYIYDVTDVLNPIFISKLMFDNKCYNFVVDSDYIYVTHDIDGLSKVDITNLSNPFIEAETNIFSKYISEYENFLFTHLDNYSYADSIIILNKENLNREGGIEVGLSYPDFRVKDLRFSNNKGFLVENYYGIDKMKSNWAVLTILDLTDPTNPIRTGNITFSESILAFTNSNDTLFIDNNNAFYAVDAIDINNPTIISVTPNIFIGNSLSYLSYDIPYLFGSYDYNSGLQIIDVQNIHNPEAGLFFDTSSKIGSVTASDSVLVAGREEGNGLYFADISDIFHPVVKERYTQNTGYVRGLKIKDDYVFAATEYGLKIFELNGLDSLSLISELNYGNTTWRIDVNDSIVAIGGYHYDVYLINVSNPKLPFITSEINITGGMLVEDIYLRNNLLFISGMYGPTMIYNITDPSKPVQLWNTGGTGWYGISMFPFDSLLFLGQYDNITIIDIKDPSVPNFVADIPISERIADIFVSDHLLFVSCYIPLATGYDGILYIFDISDFENINLISIAYTASWPNNIFVNDQYIFLSDFEDGIFIFDIDDITNVKNEEYTSKVQDFSLYQNYPNPFNPITTIGYTIPTSPYPTPYQGEGTRERFRVTLIVYDILGNEITTLVNEEKTAGRYEVEFDAIGLPSGIYFYQLKAGSFIQSKKMVLLK